MADVARVVLGMELPEVAEEVIHFLDRTERLRVVGAASDGAQLREAVRQLEPDVVVASPALLTEPLSSPVLALDLAETVPGLRRAIVSGARGFFVWPQERSELAGAASGLSGSVAMATAESGSVVVVTGARGGAGTTFVATHLAAAVARSGRRCVLVDADLAFGDVASALGVPSDPQPRSMTDLVPVAGELSERHLDEVLWRHAAGFGVLLAPEPGVAADAAYRPVIDAIAGTAEVTVVHVPHRSFQAARDLAARADRLVIVLTLDVTALRGTRRLLADGDAERSLLVVNRAASGEIVPSDVERVVGIPARVVIPVDRSVPGRQDRGRLVAARSRAGRGMDVLAHALLEEAS